MINEALVYELCAKSIIQNHVRLVADSHISTIDVKYKQMSRKIVSMQIRVTESVRERAKKVAKAHGATLSELVLKLLANTGDKELKKLVEKELKERPKPGRPW